MRTFHILPPPTEGYASFFAAMQLAKVAESPEQRELAQLPAFQFLKSLDDLDEEPDEDEEDELDLDEDEDEDEDDDDELDLDEDEDDDEDEDVEDEEDEDEDDEDEDDVKPLKMDGLSALARW